MSFNNLCLLIQKEIIFSIISMKNFSVQEYLNREENNIMSIQNKLNFKDSIPNHCYEL